MTSLSLDGHSAQPGIPSYNSVPLLSITQTQTSSSNGRYAITSWVPTTSPYRFSFVCINRWPIAFPTSKIHPCTPDPASWRPNVSGSAALRRYKTTSSISGSGHRRGAYSEYMHYDCHGVSQIECTAPDNSLLPPSSSSAFPAPLQPGFSRADARWETRAWRSHSSASSITSKLRTNQLVGS